MVAATPVNACVICDSQTWITGGKGDSIRSIGRVGRSDLVVELFSGSRCRDVVGADAERLVALPTTDHLGGLAREPMIVEAPGGTLFVTGYGEEKPTLWRSTDGGGTWHAVDVGTEANGAVGNSDVDLALGPDGTLYFVVMSYDRKASEGTGIAIASSRESSRDQSRRLHRRAHHTPLGVR
jgi:hypothetical protein